jgi:cell division protein FtsB
MSGPTETIWKTLKSVIQMESRIELLATTAREQQAKVESLTERVIRLEAQMDMLLVRAGAPAARRLPGK